MTSINTVDINLEQLCAQRKSVIEQMSKKPPIRYEGQVSPYKTYPNLTKFDFDMRRKAEILKYKASSTKSNNMTKAQSWSRISNSRSAISPYIIKLQQHTNVKDEVSNIRDVVETIVVKYPDTYTISGEWFSYEMISMVIPEL